MKLLYKGKSIGLFAQMTILILIVVIMSMLLGGYVFSIIIGKAIYKNMGHEAMAIARITATDPRIIQAFNNENPANKIQPIASELRKLTGAGYIVVGNKNGLRYSANKDSELDQEMGTSNTTVLNHGKSVIYEGVGVSGPAIKAKTPIYNSEGQIIGVSSVGFLLNDVNKEVIGYDLKIAWISIVILVIGLIGALIIARRVKKLIFGLEPEEIGFLFKEKEAILESIRDAIVAVDEKRRIVSANKKAREIFKDLDISIGSLIHNLRLENIIENVFKKQQLFRNMRVLLNRQVYIIDCSPIIQDNTIQGAVLTFRAELEVEQLLEEIPKIKGYAENLRTQNHEFLNKLNTVFGLLQLENYEMAKSLISDEIKERQDVIAFLMSSVKDPLISACLLGKINRAKELKILLEIDSDSHLDHIPPKLESKHIVTVISNIIDNALESAQSRNGVNGIVKVSFTDLGRDLVFDIEDNGYGVPPKLESLIFVDGYTTKKGDNHGLGLAIVKNTLEMLDGQVFIKEGLLGGARFTIVIPLNS